MATPSAHGHAHADEEVVLPHGSKWPIIAAMGIALLYFGAVVLAHTGSWILLGFGMAVVLAAIFGIVTEDKRWWEGNVSTGLRNGWWGVLFFLGTEVMLFAALFATYFNHRAFGGEAFGLDEHGEFFLAHAITGTGINTIILLLSGVTMHWAHSGIRKGNVKALKLGLLLTLVLGGIFLVGQVLEYQELSHAGLIVQNGTFGAVFYALTGTHGAHVLGGLGVLALVAWRTFKGQFDQKRHVAVEVAAIYWHFVDVVWVLLYAVVYLRIL